MNIYPPDIIYINIIKHKTIKKLLEQTPVKEVMIADSDRGIDAPELLDDAISTIHNVSFGNKNKKDSMFSMRDGQAALSIYQSKKSSSLVPFVLEAFLLISNDYQKISDALEIKEKVVEIYSKIFYYVSGHSYLEKYDIVEKIQNDTEKEVKDQALKFGFEFLCGFYLSQNFDMAKILVHMEKRLAQEFFFGDNETTAQYKRLVDIYSLLKKHTSSESENNQIHTLAIKILKESYSSTEVEGKTHERNDNADKQCDRECP